jgi:hypothetical protein
VSYREFIASHTRGALAGMSKCRMPYAESASTTAFITEVIASARRRRSGFPDYKRR